MMMQQIKKNKQLKQIGLKNEEAAFEAVIAVRSKHHNLTLEQAKRPEAETYVGRLFLQGFLSEQQYQAAQNFLRLRHNYLKSIGAHGIYYNDDPSMGVECFEDYARKIKDRYNACLKFVANECKHSALNIIEYVLVRDMEMPLFIDRIKKICEVIDKFFYDGLTNKKIHLN